MGFEIKGLEAVILELRNTGVLVAANARKTMHRAADRIVREAKLNCPEDTEALVDSIQKEVAYGERGRLQINVTAGNTGASNPRSGEPVDSYAQRVHEDYENIPGAPGPRTIQKREANPGRYVGEKFLDRAADEERVKLKQRMIDAVNQKDIIE